MNIQNYSLPYKTNNPFHIQLCRITHWNPHFHRDSMEFVYCLKGRVDLFTSFQHFEILEGQMVSIDCDDIHCLRGTDDNLILICNLNLTDLEEDFDFLRYVYFACETMNSYPYQKDSLEWLEQTFLSLAYDHSRHIQKDHTPLANVIPQTTPDYRSTANKMIQILMQYFNYYTYLNYEGYINRALYDRYHRIMVHCHQNYKEKISVAQLAKAENINKNYFSQFLRRTNFKNFSSLIKFIRCYEAERLLLTTSMPVAEISYACGFSDPKYFYRAFKEWWGRTPTQHRNWYRDFMAQDEQVEFIPPEESAAFIKDYMAKWMYHKMLK